MIGLEEMTKFEEEADIVDWKHTPVMVDEVIEYLMPQINGVYIDGTLGLGSHAKAILNRIGPNGTLIGIDRDAQSLTIAKEELEKFKGQCHFVHDDYRHMDKILSDLNIKDVDGILLDLGVSSYQLDDPSRGFSIKEDGPLDMRMDQDSHISAYDLVNSLSESELSNILRDFGQERWHHRIARQLVKERARNPINTTKELSQIILKAMPSNRQKRNRIHPATRAFQAFRIAVNRELESIEEVIDQCMDALNVGGRLVVIAFHSLEDRIVKHTFRAINKEGSGRALFKKPLRPSEKEAEDNPRARSARLRVCEKIK